MKFNIWILDENIPFAEDGFTDMNWQQTADCIRFLDSMGIEKINLQEVKDITLEEFLDIVETRKRSSARAKEEKDV